MWNIVCSLKMNRFLGVCMNRIFVCIATLLLIGCKTKSPMSNVLDNNTHWPTQAINQVTHVDNLTMSKPEFWSQFRIDYADYLNRDPASHRIVETILTNLFLSSNLVFFIGSYSWTEI